MNNYRTINNKNDGHNNNIKGELLRFIFMLKQSATDLPAVVFNLYEYTLKRNVVVKIYNLNYGI